MGHTTRYNRVVSQTVAYYLGNQTRSIINGQLRNPSRSTDKFLILLNKLTQVSRLLSLLWESSLQNLFASSTWQVLLACLRYKKNSCSPLVPWVVVGRCLSSYLSRNLLYLLKYSIRVLPQLDNKAHISRVLIEKFPPKRKSILSTASFIF